MPANLENSAAVTGLKRSVFIPIPKKGNAKECSNYPTIALISRQQINAQNSPSQGSIVHELRTLRCSSWIQKRQRKQRSNYQHPLDHRKSKRIPEKKSTSASLTTLNPLTVWITTNCVKIFKTWEYQTTYLPPEKPVLQAKKQQLQPDMEQGTGSKLVKEYFKTVYCHPAYLTYIQSTSCKILGWMKHKL